MRNVLSPCVWKIILHCKSTYDKTRNKIILLSNKDGKKLHFNHHLNLLV